MRLAISDFGYSLFRPLLLENEESMHLTVCMVVCLVNEAARTGCERTQMAPYERRSLSHLKPSMPLEEKDLSSTHPVEVVMAHLSKRMVLQMASQMVPDQSLSLRRLPRYSGHEQTDQLQHTKQHRRPVSNPSTLQKGVVPLSVPTTWSASRFSQLGYLDRISHRSFSVV